MDKIYIIMYDNGESWEDHQTTVNSATLDENKALVEMQRLNEVIRVEYEDMDNSCVNPYASPYYSVRVLDLF